MRDQISFEDDNNKVSLIVSNIAAGEVIKKLGAQSLDANELTTIVHNQINMEAQLEAEYLKNLQLLDKCNRVIASENQLEIIINLIKEMGFTIGFTNGCFDILHRGHTKYLDQARNIVDFLIIGVNDDLSVRSLKGITRPINNIKDRMEMLRRITLDDAFIIKFSEPTPIKLIRKIKPNILIKGGDYKKSEIVGGDFVIKNKGILKIIPFVKGCSTTNIIKKINKLSD